MINKIDDSDKIQGRSIPHKYDIVFQAKLMIKIRMTHEYSPNDALYSDAPLFL